ncbi:MAG: hypothetical protein KDK45_25635 [Leptospiraceae bacterium]|nr:hypothetical protein [Leptospiraceae bacterium]
MTLDSSFGFVFKRKKLKTQAPEFKELESFMASFPFMFLFGFLMYTCLSLNILNLSLSYFSIHIPSFLSNVVNILNIIAVVYILPNVLRQTCLQFISSNIHYFGDIREGRDGTLEQTQVLNSPLFILPHLFCFNFGSTHGIHHIVVNQPFYIRQMVASEAHRAMKEEGMRFNDFGTFLRANRYHKESYKAA